MKDRHEMHGGCGTREYNSWCHMKSRCYNPNSPRFVHYGARGITVCDAWLDSFGTFFRDMGTCPPKHTLHRIDNDGPYSPENCCWASNRTQANNKQINLFITAYDETHTLQEWARLRHMNREAIKARLDRGWTPEDALSAPVRECSTEPITFNGKTQSVSAWARELGITQTCLWARLQTWDVEEALTRPVRVNHRDITFNGRTQYLVEWARELGIGRDTLRKRLDLGMPVEEALSPHKPRPSN